MHAWFGGFLGEFVDGSLADRWVEGGGPAQWGGARMLAPQSFSRCPLPRAFLDPPPAGQRTPGPGGAAWKENRKGPVVSCRAQGRQAWRSRPSRQGACGPGVRLHGWVGEKVWGPPGGDGSGGQVMVCSQRPPNDQGSTGPSGAPALNHFLLLKKLDFSAICAAFNP